jgi:hypothetical protein
MGEKAD